MINTLFALSLATVTTAQCSHIGEVTHATVVARLAGLTESEAIDVAQHDAQILQIISIVYDTNIAELAALGGQGFAGMVVKMCLHRQR